ncbi:alpha/beta fold hydrolase [Amycolatopsis jiangsuensis]|uniref:Pimeloyl-ACP methyl ester carboxylesterase n=1 Tax=Amycolatopsis jiangsuensis TaxID=1181879 RepID=A0A840J704_9PSEU|nr:alpha/beta hydrolase [Amycolatopsis jiangsuensis]MBB4689194.1 pimeloyl-ACP methyl ester carboxylesterase [Amycolatopsis jiangsuensis]
MIRRIRLRTALLSAGAAVLATVGVSAAVPSAATQAVATTTVSTVAGAASAKPAEPKPTVVLVHGAWADSSGWAGVITRLTKAGYPVVAAGNPLRGLAIDTAAVKDVLRGIEGPIVLVGHSYGGAVITNAAAGDRDVKALVYVAALAPDAGESLADLSAQPIAHPIPPAPVREVPTVAVDGTKGVDRYLACDAFRATFAADVDPVTAATMALTQRPLAASASAEKTEATAWRTIPSWYLVSTQDRVIAPDEERYLAARAKAHTEEVHASHAVMVSRPGVVAHLIIEADHGTR